MENPILISILLISIFLISCSDVPTGNVAICPYYSPYYWSSDGLCHNEREASVMDNTREYVLQENTGTEIIEEPEKTCRPDYLNEFRCNDDLKEQKYRSTNCSLSWISLEMCKYGCKNGECESKPEDKCDSGFLDKARCSGNGIEKKYQYSNCDTEWVYLVTCNDECVNGECIQTTIIPTENETEEEPPEEETPDVVILVTKVIDGDTVDLNNGERVRLLGIDTPERGEYYYFEATERMEELVEGNEVELTKDDAAPNRGIYGRLLRYVYVGDIFVNKIMVEEGYAKNYPYGQDLEYKDLFAEQFYRNPLT